MGHGVRERVVDLFLDEFGRDWLNQELDQRGFMYDLERAFSDFNGTYTVRLGADGRVLCRVEPAGRFDNLSQLDLQFCQLWGEVAEPFNFIQRSAEGGEVCYEFLTGSEAHGHSGRIVFSGDAVRHLASRYRIARVPASMLRESPEGSDDRP